MKVIRRLIVILSLNPDTTFYIEEVEDTAADGS